ncbi:MAG: hypothetical protein N3C12_11835 [Candidatus Binatia bacterium]|nr:hypothetical protein [Candidatus Binatia bacterium]
MTDLEAVRSKWGVDKRNWTRERQQTVVSQPPVAVPRAPQTSIEWALEYWDEV